MFNVNSTGRPRVDALLQSGAAQIVYVTPRQAMRLMADACSNRGVNAAVTRRLQSGGQARVDHLVSLVRSGVLLNVPFVDVQPDGRCQDGFHRCLAAEALGVKSMPLVVHRVK